MCRLCDCQIELYKCHGKHQGTIFSTINQSFKKCSRTWWFFLNLFVTTQYVEQLYYGQQLPETPVNNNFISCPVDNIALAIFPCDAPQNFCPVNIIGGGNCLFRSSSLAIFRTESYHLEMRARAIVELLCHTDHYLSGKAMFHTDNSRLLFW